MHQMPTIEIQVLRVMRPCGFKKTSYASIVYKNVQATEVSLDVFNDTHPV